MKNKKLKIIFGLITLLIICAFFTACQNNIMHNWWESRETGTDAFAVVIFDSNGGIPQPKAIRIAYGHSIGRLQPMTRSSDGFIGWYDERNMEWDVEKDPVNRNNVNNNGILVLTARWVSSTPTNPLDPPVSVYTVTFEDPDDLYEGNPPGQQFIAEGYRIVQPTVPKAKPPYDKWFDGWEDEDGNIWDFNNPVTRNIVLKTITETHTDFCIVRFEPNGGTRPDGFTTLTHEFTVSYRMGNVPHPGPLVKDGYYFGGWYTDGFTKLWDFDIDTVSADYPQYTPPDQQVLTLFARWIPTTRTIIFEQNGGWGLSQTVFQVPIGTKLIDPGNPGNPGTPTRTGYTPRGWFPDPSCTPGTGLRIMDWEVPEPEVLMELEPIYFYAGWMTTPWYVTFNIIATGSQIGTNNPVTGKVEDQYVNHGNLIERPIIVPAAGRYLDGKWYKTYDSATGIFSNEWDFNTDRVTSNTDLYARYDPDGFIVKFSLDSPINGPRSGNGGLETPADQYIVTDGTGRVIEPFMPPSSSGNWSFLRWDKSDGTPYNFDDPVTSSFTLYARWVEHLPDMVWVPRGSFIMGDSNVSGSPAAYHAYPTRRVTVDGFYISRYMITQRTYPALSGNPNGLRGYSEVMGNNPSQFTADPDRPVENVSWSMAMDYCDALNSALGLINHSRTSLDSRWLANGGVSNGFRLPTEAEWEYAARGGYFWQEYFTKGFIYAGSSNAMDVAWYNESVKQQPAGSQSTQPVGKKTPNQLGIYDMSGNLSEWCYDGFASYTIMGTGPFINPVWNSGTERVRRGGAWNNAAGNVRVTVRNSAPPTDAHWALGFRVVRGPATIW